MFKSWSKKHKIKAVFKLDFHVTQVPKMKKPAVMISLVPEDAGKASVKLEKVAVQDGTCTWENPVYEPVKLVAENKTGKINEKIYHFIVSTGSSKSGYLGEASIDFSDFVEEIAPVTVSLPLKFANSGAILHVIIQRMLDPGDESFREDPRTLTNNASMESHENSWDTDGNNLSFNEEKDLNGYGQQNEVVDSSVKVNKVQNRRTLNWSADSTSDDSLTLALESPSSQEDNVQRESSTDSVVRLKNEVTALMRQAELSELEIQSLRRHIEKETRQGQNLSRQIVSLKEERNTIKLDYERLKSSDESESKKIQEMRNELSHWKKLSDDLQLQLHETQDANSELTLVAKDLEDLVERKNRVISDLSAEVETARNESQGHDKLEEIKQLKLNYDLLKQEKHGISLKLKRSEEDRASLETECDDHAVTINELESQVARLEETIKKQALDFAEALISIDELESQGKALEDELEKQAKRYEDEIDAIKRAKIEQEEALKASRLTNSIKAERLQEDLRNLSMEMSVKVNENEKQAIEAQMEASELRLENKMLEDKLQKITREMWLIKENEKVNSEELVNKIDLKENQIRKLSAELDNKSLQLECSRKEEEESHEAFLTQIQMLRAEIERLNGEKSNLAEAEAQRLKLRAETEKMKKLISEKETVIQRLNKENASLEAKITKKESKVAPFHASHRSDMTNLVTEVASLKEKNKSMEKELKDMEGRYSEVSLRFAEVEGERQQLVMTVRNLKNGKK